MRNRLFIKVLKLTLIYVVIFVTLQLLIQHQTSKHGSFLAPFSSEDKDTDSEDISSQNASNSLTTGIRNYAHRINKNKTEPKLIKHENKSEENPLKHWIVMLTVNFGFFDIFQNWLWHFQRHHLNISVVVIAEDDKSFQKLILLYRHTLTIERSSKNNTDSAVNFGSQSFKKLVSERPSHILKYLELGKNVLYCDADTVWVQNPFPYLVGEFDIWAQYDATEYCTGFLAIKTNERTIQFAKNWEFYMSQRSNINDQEGFNAVNKAELQIQKLDITLFPYGLLYFSKFNNAQRAKVVVVHNNWIVGHDNKVRRFKMFSLWQNNN